jgi:hypothetical protein
MVKFCVPINQRFDKIMIDKISHLFKIVPYYIRVGTADCFPFRKLYICLFLTFVCRAETDIQVLDEQIDLVQLEHSWGRSCVAAWKNNLIRSEQLH